MPYELLDQLFYPGYIFPWHGMLNTLMILEIVAQFPEGDVKIVQFENLDKDTTPAKA